jgi:WD40 repeat protein
LAFGSADVTAKLWDVATGQELATLGGHGHPVWSIGFSPDGRTLAATSGEHTVRLWS